MDKRTLIEAYDLLIADYKASIQGVTDKRARWNAIALIALASELQAQLKPR